MWHISSVGPKTGKLDIILTTLPHDDKDPMSPKQSGKTDDKKDNDKKNENSLDSKSNPQNSDVSQENL